MRALQYRALCRDTLRHEAVNHSAKGYVRYSARETITTNTVEGFY